MVPGGQDPAEHRGAAPHVHPEPTRSRDRHRRGGTPSLTLVAEALTKATPCPGSRPYVGAGASYFYDCIFIIQWGSIRVFMLDLRDKKILVTGGAGFLGTHVVQVLKDRGVPEKNIVVPHREEHDLRSAEACREVTKGIDVVIHLAGITGDGQFHREHSAEIFHDNLAMGVELIEAARVNGVKKFVTAG